MLLRLELVVVNQGDDPLPVHYVSLSPSQSAEEISWHTECLPYFVAFIAEKRVREVVLCLESLHRNHLAMRIIVLISVRETEDKNYFNMVTTTINYEIQPNMTMRIVQK